VAGDGLEELRTPGTHQPVDAHDLPTADLEREVVDHVAIG
jgi:hypothetical protein